MNDDARRLLAFWFGPAVHKESHGNATEVAAVADATHRARWFAADEQFDQQCRAFEGLLQQSTTGGLQSWLDHPAGMLAHIILCDQIPRNIYRGTARAFAWDAIALEIARNGLESGADRTLGWDERSFFYMPFEHSEDLLDQHLAVGLFTFLRDSAPRSIRDITGNALRYAQKHRDIIAQFGRFPHRNDALGRVSTDAEQAFTRDSDGFGQTR